MIEYVFPQLEYHYRNKYEIANFNEVFTKPSLMNSELIIPDSIDNIVYSNNIFNLLFNDDYNYSDYVYTFTTMYTSDMTSELKYTTSGSYFLVRVCKDHTSENLFNINSEDINMLDLLLLHRHGDIITLPSLDLNYYGTELSKLIFVYLYYKLYNEKFPDYNEIITNENSNLLNLLYEDFIIREIYKYLRG